MTNVDLIILESVIMMSPREAQETYGKGPECYFLNSAFCPLLEMQTYFWIKFGLSTEIER